MKVKHRINAGGDCWYGCTSVVFEDQTARWKLNPDRKYDLLKAFERKPHRQLMEAVDDDSLRAFLEEWGPLRFSLDAWSGTERVATFRRERDLLRTWILLFTGLQRQTRLNDLLVCLLKLEPDPFCIFVRQRLNVPGSLDAPPDEQVMCRLSHASDHEIFDICTYLVGVFPVPTPKLVMLEYKKKVTLRPSLGTYSLCTALYWMVWQDIVMETPFEFCEECHRLIEQTSKHKRKFCPDGCARRVAARNWRRRDLEKKRLAKGSEMKTEDARGTY